MTWIRVVPWSEADGRLKDAYDWQAERLGEPTEFTMLGSLYPEVVMERLKLYKVVEGCPSRLAPGERLLAAYFTSLLNSTPHCASGLSDRLAHDTDLQAATAAVERAAAARQPVASTGDERLDAICAYAGALTLDPATVTEAHIDRLHAVGLDDLDVLDLNNLCAYYSYINRVATGLGLKTVIPPVHARQALPTSERS